MILADFGVLALGVVLVNLNVKHTNNRNVAGSSCDARLLIASGS